MFVYPDIPFQITHLCDFEYWKIFQGLTVEEIKEREASCDYPPRLQIQCEQIDFSKSLFSSFEVSKKNWKMPIAQFPLVKKVSGNHACMYMANCIMYVYSYVGT